MHCVSLFDTTSRGGRGETMTLIDMIHGDKGARMKSLTFVRDVR